MMNNQFIKEWETKQLDKSTKVSFFYYDEKTLKKEAVEFSEEMYDILDQFKSSIPRIRLNDVDFKDYDGAYSIIVGNDKKSLTFGIPRAKTRHEREMGKDLYFVTISKHECSTDRTP